MKVNPNWFWKNWQMGTELQISGSFIYNAIFVLDQIESFKYEADCFEFLYNSSVGIERLLKIAIILTEHDKVENQEEFEKSLITHSNRVLLDRLEKHHNINLDSKHNRFIGILDKFYKTTRYDRFLIDSVFRESEAKKRLVTFVAESLNIKPDLRDPSEAENIGEYITISENKNILDHLPVTNQVRKFIGKIIGKIVTQVYDIIYEESHRNRTFTYEIPYGSKSFKIFIAKEFDFTNERITQREVFLHLLKTKLDKNIQEFIDDIPPINLGSRHTNKYISTLFNYEKDRSVTDELEFIYSENKPDLKTRLKQLEILGSEYNFEPLWSEEEE